MKNIIYLILTIVVNYTLAFATECPVLIEQTDSGLVKVIKTCEVQKNIAANIRENHEKNINKELARKLAKKISQSSEEFSLLTTFFNNKGSELLQSEKSVQSQCQLEKFKEIEKCPNGKKSKFFQQKLESMKQFLPNNKSTPFKDDQSLFGIVAGKFYSDLGLKSYSDKMKCPLDSTGSFSLNGQLDDLSADYICEQLSKSKFAISGLLFDSYPQLKIIQNTHDKDFIERFINFIKNKPKEQSSNEYISSFFLEKKNKEIISKSIATQCETMNSNLQTFLCSDLDELGSLDNKVSHQLFNDLDTEEPFAKQDLDFKNEGILTAFGFQCMAKENIKKFTPVNSVDKWFNEFVKDTRADISDSSGNALAVNFCSKYECKVENSAIFPSCKKGGPISSVDLRSLLKCNISELSNGKCTPQSLKEIKYLESIEMLVKDMKDKNTLTSNDKVNITSQFVKGRLPSFAENFFGAEGTLKALGKTPTPLMIAEKIKDIEERSSMPSSPQAPSVAAAPPIQEAPAQRTQAAQATPAPAPDTSSDIKPDYSPSQRNYASAVAPKSSSSSRSDTSKSVKIMPDNSDARESAKIRKEMEDMIKGMKQDPFAEAESASPVASSSSSKAEKKTEFSSSGSSAATKAEEERLKRVARNLDARENALDEYKRELDNRSQERSVSQDGPSTNSKSSKAGISGGSESSGSNSSASSSGSGSGSSLKLSAANPKGDQKINTAAIIQSGKETSTLSVDELAKLSPDGLKTLGIDSTKPFVLRVNFKEKTYEVPVKALMYKGNNILGPVIDPKNKDLKELLLQSPLFKPYREYRMERESFKD